MATVRVQAAESGSGPNELIDWAVVFMAEGHHRNVNDDKDELMIGCGPFGAEALIPWTRDSLH